MDKGRLKIKYLKYINIISNNNFGMKIIHSSSTHLTFPNVIYRKMLMMKKNSKTFNRTSNTSSLILMGY